MLSFVCLVNFVVSSDEKHRLAMQGIRDRHPGFNERQVVIEYARITLSEPLWRAAFAAEATKRE